MCCVCITEETVLYYASYTLAHINVVEHFVMCTKPMPIQCVPEKRKPINRVNFSENCNDLSEKVYIVTKFSLFSFF